MIRQGLSWGTPPPAATPAATVSDRYLGDRVSTAAPAELTMMLYEEALRCIDTAAQLYDAGEHASALPQLVKAQRIVTELRTSLNPAGGDISITLESVYTWVYRQLLEAVSDRDQGCLTEARNCLTPIAQAWATSVLGRG